jgi:hypothetical protein
MEAFGHHWLMGLAVKGIQKLLFIASGDLDAIGLRYEASDFSSSSKSYKKL